MEDPPLMSTLDVVITVAYFCVVFGIGAYFFKRARTSRSYFLADRSVGWIRDRRVALRDEHLERALHRPGRLRSELPAWRSAISNGSPF